ncbi:MAG: cyclohexanone monooxygenase [Sphingomonas bacterium]|nr:cyclohexanone monooxygenase [Sphingomonas bacterium]
MVNQTQELDVLVVGAGFAGLYMLHKLRSERFSVHAVEAGAGVGGTWFWNRYPGARCDVPSVEYSYSFSPELEQEWRWSERYAAQPEILSYLEHVTERFDLARDISFNTRVASAHWNEGDRRWLVATDAGDTYAARYVILATGALSEPKAPDLPGLGEFKGSVLHTAKWDENVDLAGKRVAVFGTGSSGIQVVPPLARTAGQLVVFQRTPNFAVPANNHAMTDELRETMQRELPDNRAAARQSALGFFAQPRSGSAKAESDEAREARFEEQWRAGTTGLLLAYEDLLIDEESNSYAAEFARRKIAATVEDPEVARKVTPQGYPLGSRRMCSEIGFYEALNRDNVRLVDVREEPVTAITADTIETAADRYSIDAIVFATGFDAMVGAIKAIDVRGGDGRSLREEWSVGPRSYLGLAVAGFPNLFTVNGPGSPSVLSNVVLSIEQHVDWIVRCLADLRAHGSDRIEATEEAESAWMDHANEVAHSTLFPRANSWYQGRTRDGRDVFMPYVGGCGAYRHTCDEIAADDYRGFRIAHS